MIGLQYCLIKWMSLLPPILVFISVAFYLSFNLHGFGLRSPGLHQENTSRFYLTPSSHAERPASTRTYNFTLAEEVLSPNGVEKTVFTVNGLFPGPSIEVRSGDVLVVNVFNKLSEGTSLHWHGLKHPSGSNSQDGASGVTQCPIAPGANFTYRIQISPEQSGTFWYHSHHATQRADGLFGALIIHPPTSSGNSPGSQGYEHPTSDELRRIRSEVVQKRSSGTVEQVMLIGDWYHRSGTEVFSWYQSLRSHGNEPVPDAILNNGHQAFNCSTSLAEINCDPAKGGIPFFKLDPSHRNIVRFINPGSIADIHISLDSHLFRILEADGTLIKPVIVKEFLIAPGQRYAVEILNADHTTGYMHNSPCSFWLRQRVEYQDFKYPNPSLDLESKSIITYDANKCPRSKLPTTNSWSTLTVAPDEILDPLSLQPLDESATVLPPAEGVVMMYVTTMKRTATGNKPFGYVNQTTWKPNLSNPVLARDNAESSKKELIVPVRTSHNESSVSSVVLDIIINNLEDGPHPFHLHGHHFWPLYTYEARMGAGSYRWDRPPVLPTTAPALRDTFVIPPKGHAVFRVRFDTPGMWVFHCHVLVHMQSGMAMIFDVFGDHILDVERMSAIASCTSGSN